MAAGEGAGVGHWLGRKWAEPAVGQELGHRWPEWAGLPRKLAEVLGVRVDRIGAGVGVGGLMAEVGVCFLHRWAGVLAVV